MQSLGGRKLHASFAPLRMTIVLGQDKEKGGSEAALLTFSCLLDHSILALSTWIESPLTVPVTAT